MSTVLYRGGPVHAAGPRPGHGSGAGAPTALLVDDDTIGWLGGADAAPSADRVVDLHGANVMPAFVDAHVHATATGLALEGLDLRQAGTLADALGLVEAHVRRARGAAVLGHGWDETRWPERRAPTRQELDRASYGGVVYLSRVDSHSAVVSSALLAAQPQASSLPGFDDSGWLRQEAHHAVRRAARETLSAPQRAAAQRATRRRAAELGIACLHEMAGPDISGAADLTGLLALAREEPGPEVIAYWGEVSGIAAGSQHDGIAAGSQHEGIDLARELGATGVGGDLFVDGSIGSHTASLRGRYVDKDTCGALYLEPEAITGHIVACTEAGLQAGFHAIGDGALDALLAGSFPAAAAAVGIERLRVARHRIEHAEMLDDRLIEMMRRFGIVASVQPAFDAAWGGDDGMYAQRLGAGRALSMNPLARLVDARVPLAFGSDSPVTPLDPWGSIRAAMRHKTAGSAVSAAQAFAAHTRGGWYAARRDAEGVLAVGAPATFAVWRGDLIDDEGDAPAPMCVRTVVRGLTVYDVEGSLG